MKGAVCITSEADCAHFSVSWMSSAAVSFGKMAVVFSPEVMHNHSNQH